MFAAKGIFEPPKYFPFGTGHNWEVEITCKTYIYKIVVTRKTRFKIMMGRKPFFKALDNLYEDYAKKHKYLGIFENAR